jgi:hypothetical protein
MNITDNTIYVHNGIPLVHTQINDKISGFLPAAHTKLADEPRLSVSVGKITLTQWRSVVSFFSEINKREKSEAQVRLFYSDERQNWKIWAFPQKSNTGMTTSEIPDDPEWNDQWNNITENGLYYQWGTIHSHCNAGAFASSTDKDDEANSPGLHITIGHLDKDLIDLDIRFTLICPGNKDKPAYVSQQKVNLFDFVDCEVEKYLTNVAPPSLRNYANTTTIKMNTSDQADSALVEEWIKNRREKQEPRKYYQQNFIDEENDYYSKAREYFMSSERYNNQTPISSLPAINNKNIKRVKNKKLPQKNINVYKSPGIKELEKQNMTD